MRALPPAARVAVFGHDPIREGHLVEHEPLPCVPSNFARYDGGKAYLEWDLGVPADRAETVARGGLRSQHPDAPRRFRGQRTRPLCTVTSSSCSIDPIDHGC